MVALQSKSITRAEKFVNEVSDELHLLTGVQQRFTNAYHPQQNGLVKRQNRTIKNSLVSVLDKYPLKRLSIIEGVVLVHRVSKHFSTKYSPSKLLYNQEPVLQIDVKCKLSSTENSDAEQPFDKSILDAVLISSNVIREEVYRKAGKNINRAQKKQQGDCESRNISSASNYIYIGTEVLLRNNKRKDKKSRKFTFIWLWSYITKKVVRYHQKDFVTLKNNNYKKLKKSITSTSETFFTRFGWYQRTSRFPRGRN